MTEPTPKPDIDLADASPNEALAKARPLWRRQLRRRVVRTLLIAIGSVLGIVVGLAVLLHTKLGQELVRRQIEQRLGARVNGSVELRELRVALFGNLGIRGLRIRDA